MPSSVGHGACMASSGVPPNPMMCAHDVRGVVGADIGELLGAHVGDRRRERGQHEREAFRDAAGMDARRRAASRQPRRGVRDRFDAGLLRSGYTQPTGVTTFLPDRKIATTSSSLGISGLYMTQSASRARTSSTSVVAVTPSGVAADELTDVDAVLLALCTQHPTSSSSG